MTERPFRVGDMALLRQSVGDLPRGTVVRIISRVETSSDPAYLVQPLVSTVPGRVREQPEPIGPELTIDGALLARSLPDFRSGITFG